MASVNLILAGKHGLALGLTALIDEEDLLLVGKYKWNAQKHRSRVGVYYFYASASIDGNVVLLHRFLCSARSGEVVDHRNHNTLDNRRENLRVCTHAENMRNRAVNRNSATGVKGVTLDKRLNKFRAEIRANGKRITLGRFASIDDAAAAYRAASIKYHGDFGSVG